MFASSHRSGVDRLTLSGIKMIFETFDIANPFSWQKMKSGRNSRSPVTASFVILTVGISKPFLCSVFTDPVCQVERRV